MIPLGTLKSSALFTDRGNRFAGFGGDATWVADAFEKTNSWPFDSQKLMNESL
jgi:hypothetical protein